jgi:hypothetical protein
MTLARDDHGQHGGTLHASFLMQDSSPPLLHAALWVKEEVLST